MADVNFEVQLKQIKEKIKQCVAIEDYQNMLIAIRAGIECCNKAIRVSVATRAELFKKNLEALNTLEEKCLTKLDEKNVEEVVSIGDTSSSKKDSKKSVASNNKEIQYVINGVDVKQFLTIESNEVVTFEDVKGMEDEKRIIQREFFISEKQRLFNESIGKKSKTFMLLFGVPGTGKTFFAKAISCELKVHNKGKEVPFFSVVGSQLKDCKVGASEKNIQAVFEFCKQFDNCVLFIDEFDAIAPDRKINTGDPTAGTTVTTLLQMMDGFGSSQGTLVIAATNCPYNLDGAVLSRANVRIEIPLPTTEVIESVLNAKISNKFASDVSVKEVAQKLNGYSNRDVKNFIENLKDQLSDAFALSEEKNQNLSYADIKCTRAMIATALNKIVPTTKVDDLRRIQEFKTTGQ